MLPDPGLDPSFDIIPDRRQEYIFTGLNRAGMKLLEKIHITTDKYIHVDICTSDYIFVTKVFKARVTAKLKFKHFCKIVNTIDVTLGMLKKKRVLFVG